MRWGGTLAVAGAALGVAAFSQASAAPLARSFSQSRPVVWVSVAAGEPSQGVGRDGRRRHAQRGRRAHLPRAALDQRVPARAGRAGDAAGRRQDAARHAGAVVGRAVHAAALVERRRRHLAGGDAQGSRRALRLRPQARVRGRVSGDGRPDRPAHRLVLPGQPLRHARRRAHLGGGVAALQAAVALRGDRHLAGQGAHADPARAVEGQEPQADPGQAHAQRRWRRDLARARGPALSATRLQRPRARLQSRRAPRRCS